MPVTVVGAAMAKRDELTLDFAAGIPDSGVGHAIGYSNEKGIPYKRPFCEIYTDLAAEFYAAKPKYA